MELKYVTVSLCIPVQGWRRRRCGEKFRRVWRRTLSSPSNARFSRSTSALSGTALCLCPAARHRQGGSWNGEGRGRMESMRRGMPRLRRSGVSGVPAPDLWLESTNGASPQISRWEMVVSGPATCFLGDPEDVSKYDPS